LIVKAEGRYAQSGQRIHWVAERQYDRRKHGRHEEPAPLAEPGQTPEFDEYTVVLRGLLRVNTSSGTIDIKAGESIIVEKGEWTQYGSPMEEGAEYVSVCIPAFSPGIAHRDEK
jgi:mannose-6-phosphate isomerase-like protein (cupin superfamily)